MNKDKDAERRFSNLSAAAAVLICGVLQVRTLGDGQVVEHLARYNAKGSRAKVSWISAGSRGGSANTTRTTEGSVEPSAVYHGWLQHCNSLWGE